MGNAIFALVSRALTERLTAYGSNSAGKSSGAVAPCMDGRLRALPDRRCQRSSARRKNSCRVAAAACVSAAFVAISYP